LFPSFLLCACVCMCVCAEEMKIEPRALHMLYH
jgi:hypothetical protein